MHRLLATLENRRFVQFDRTESKWHVGAQRFAVGATFARRRNFSAQAMPYLRKLRDLTRETANLAVVDDEFIIVLTRMESREIMRSLTKVGGRVAMVASGVGKAVLATYSDADVNAIIRHHGMPRLTEKSIVRPGDLFRELETIRRQGYAVDDEEACMGLRCIAAVVYNDCSRAIGGDFRLRHDQPRHRRAAARARANRARRRGRADGCARRRDAGGETAHMKSVGSDLRCTGMGSAVSACRPD